MFRARVWVVAFVSTLFANGVFASDTSSTTPSATVDGNSSAPRPTGKWISPEYKWFFEYPLPISPVKDSKLTYTNESSGALIDYYEVEVKTLKKQIYPNLPECDMIGYDGITPGPTFVMRQGREAVVRFTNNGPTNVSVHVHGQYNRAPFDGWAADYALPGQYKDYYYPNAQNARTIWYHDHTEFVTGEHTYQGQEGFYIITDPEEQALGLPSGKYDVALGLASRVYRANGSLWYETNNDVGLWGDIIQVNGQPWPYFEVEPRKYRLRLLNGAVSRTFHLSFHEGLDGEVVSFYAIASDSGLFSHPVNTDSIAISMGERYEAVVDFSKYAGHNITLRNSRGLGENVDYAATDLVMRFVVGGSVSDDTNNGDVPSDLHYIPPPPTSAPAKDFTFERIDSEWLINGVGFTDVENRILTRPQRGADEIWTLHNGNGNGTHPVHIHLVDFQVLSRTGGRNTVLPYESAGMKDVVWLAGGETIQVVARYAPWDGIYMFHCHNLVHEDHDMLVAFNVTQLEKWGYDNSTIFIDPMQPEFRPKDIKSEDYTEDAILKKLEWFFSTNAYNKGDVSAVYSALDAYATGGTPLPPASTETPRNISTLQTVSTTAPTSTITTPPSSEVHESWSHTRSAPSTHKSGIY
ncbi:bilirubin oxidase [Massariosphaeria phaeospora]|uniref:Bilirubin oxidase n=1 Tax=Massariosphaeria phaeospora TaxID=100035 RepID=A0A7C8I5W0_9PLEO|nr:bilirubin oxidase [Massariosphaeria phaeospora]